MPDERARSDSAAGRGDEPTPGRRGLLRRVRAGTLITAGTAGALLAAGGGVEIAPLVGHLVASTPEGLAAASAAAGAALTGTGVRVTGNPRMHSSYSPWKGHNPKSVMRRISLPAVALGAGAAGAAAINALTGGVFGGDTATIAFATTAAASGSFGAVGSALTTAFRGRPGWSRGRRGDGLE